MTTERITHALSCDLEDYDELAARLYFGLEVPPSSAVLRNTRVLLDAFAHARARGTFFVLGSIAAAFPELIRTIHGLGHEIAVHGYSHRPCDQLTPEEFRADLQRALDRIRDAVPEAALRGYRAPLFSFSRRTPWVPEVLAELGFRYDSSIFPAVTAHYGYAGAPRVPFRHPSGVIEVPMSTIRLAGRLWPVGGGGYLRWYPYGVTRWALRRLERRGRSAVTYMHPYELDTDSRPFRRGSPPVGDIRPRDRMWWLKDGLQRYNRRHTLKKLNRMLDEFSFQPIWELIEAAAATLPIIDLRREE